MKDEFCVHCWGIECDKCGKLFITDNPFTQEKLYCNDCKED